MQHDHKKAHYARLRRQGVPAGKALARSREFTGADYGSTRVFRLKDHTWNKPNPDGVAWIESLSKAGLRFVGYADELAPRSIQHKGWYGDDFGDSIYRGAVLQRQAIDGKPVFLSAYESPSDSGPFRVEVARRHWHIGESADIPATDQDACRDAAIAADRLAERDAEQEREYQEAWQAGRAAREKRREAGQAWLAAISAFRDIWNARRTLKRETVLSHIRAIRTARGKFQDATESARRERDDSRPSARDETLLGAWFEGYANG